MSSIVFCHITFALLTPDVDSFSALRVNGVSQKLSWPEQVSLMSYFSSHVSAAKVSFYQNKISNICDIHILLSTMFYKPPPPTNSLLLLRVLPPILPIRWQLSHTNTHTLTNQPPRYFHFKEKQREQECTPHHLPWFYWTYQPLTLEFPNKIFPPFLTCLS